ncbi:MAG: radical SAM family heme chaperone HemW [Calditrichaeota bacterium]|nr:radical SAM family heme chaperone HemW [Calditrichota bacterium]
MSVYVHVPFCVRKCTYCAFYSVPLGERKPPRSFLDALLKEVKLRQSELRGKTVTSVYFGGGTPSLLPPTWVGSLLNELAGVASFSPSVEITLECNPGTTEHQSLRAYRDAGVNRLSVGIQSFHDVLLRFLGRIHSADEGRRTLAQARAAGFDNISADLIFGIPSQRIDDVLSDVQELVSFGVVHVSAYELTVEKGTPLADRARSGRVSMPDEATVAEMFLAIHARLEAAGFEHYEVSNYAHPGRRSRHNLTYWHRLPYVGLGPSAHSFNGRERSWNSASWEHYVEQLSKNERPLQGREVLSKSEALEEEIALSLRLAEGLDLDRFAAQYGEQARSCIRRNAWRWSPFLVLEDQQLRPTPEGLLRADQLALEVLKVVAECNEK